MGGRSKKSLKQFLASFFHVSSWKLALVLILLLFVSATLLRIDHLRMDRLLNQVLELDSANASDEELAAALDQLNHFTTHHIIVNRVSENGQESIVFGTGPFYLEQQYLRHANAALADAQKRADADSTNPNGNVYQKAASVCDALSRRYGWGFNANYINCYQEELAKYPTTDSFSSTITAALPSTELYRRDIASPIWYPCFSGLIILVSALIALILFARFVIWATVQLAVLIFERRR